MLKSFASEVVKNPTALSRKANEYGFETLENILFDKCGKVFLSLETNFLR